MSKHLPLPLTDQPVDFIDKLLEMELDYALAVSVDHPPHARWLAIANLTQLGEFTGWRITPGDPTPPLATELIARLNQAGRAVTSADLWPVIQPDVDRSRHAFHAAEQQKISKPLAGFSYEYAPIYFDPVSQPSLTLHFRNAFGPDSPFNHLPELRAALLRIVQDTQSTHPEITAVQCASWLNETRNFPALFPEEWLTHSKRVPIEGNLGWWGQFIDRAGQFNEPLASKFRQTWQFPFHNRHCQCSLAALHDHLTSINRQ